MKTAIELTKYFSDTMYFYLFLNQKQKEPAIVFSNPIFLSFTNFYTNRIVDRKRYSIKICFQNKFEGAEG